MGASNSASVSESIAASDAIATEAIAGAKLAQAALEVLQGEVQALHGKVMALVAATSILVPSQPPYGTHSLSL